jgi:hypothetical protein
MAIAVRRHPGDLPRGATSFPQSQSPVVARRGEVFAVWAEGNGTNAKFMIDACDFFPRVGIPNPCGTLFFTRQAMVFPTRRSQVSAIVAQSHHMDGSFMLYALLFFSGTGIPYPCRTVPARRRQTPPVSTEGDGEYGIVMSHTCDLLAGGDIPDSRDPVFACCG